MGHIQKRSYRSKRTGKVKITWQGRYTAPDGHEISRRFDRKIDAEAWLVTNSADVARGQWINPVAGQISVRTFAGQWLAQRVDLRPTTMAKYRSLLDRHICPSLGDISLCVNLL